MGKVIYSGVNAEGEVKNGYIDALNNQEAMEKLKQDGLKEIKLHSDAIFSKMADDLKYLNDKELEHIAAKEIDFQKGRNLGGFLLEVLRNNFIPSLGALAMVWHGYNVQSYLWVSFGVIIASILPFISLWNYRALVAYEEAQKALAFADLAKLKELSHKLKSLTKNKDVLVESDILEAKYLAMSGDMDGAVKILLQHKEYYDLKNKGMYESVLGNLYLYAKDHKKALEHLKKAYELSQENLFLADWAMFEARFGDLNIAKQNLSNVNLDLIPVYGKPFIYFTEGLIEYKEGRYEDAKEFFLDALYDAIPYQENPATWAMNSMIRVYLALAYSRLGLKDEAKEVLNDDIILITKAHAEKELLDEMNELGIL